MKIHEKKLMRPFFDAVLLGRKPFELRKNDCDYQVDDLLILKEWDGKAFTGREITTEITYILEGYAGLQEGYCILGIKMYKETKK